MTGVNVYGSLLRKSVTSECPKNFAHACGVACIEPSRALGSAPADNKSLTISKWPPAAAECSGVTSFCPPRALTSACDSISSCAISHSPRTPLRAEAVFRSPQRGPLALAGGERSTVKQRGYDPTAAKVAGELSRSGRTVGARLPLDKLPKLTSDDNVSFVEVGESIKPPRPTIILAKRC